MKNNAFDVVVVGAGMIGLAAALAMARCGYRVAIVDPVDPTTSMLSSTGRVSAIAFASQRLLSSLGAWADIGSDYQTPYDSMSVWDGNGQGRLDFSAADANLPQLGHIVFNQAIQMALLAQLKNTTEVSFYFGCAVETLELGERQVALGLDNRTALTAGLIVAADGAKSRVRALLQFAVNEQDYQNEAIVGTVQTTVDHQRCARQVYHQTPLAFLPLADPHQCSFVWSLLPEEAAELMACDDQAFGKKIAAAMEGRYGEVSLLGKRQCFPLVRRHSQQYIAERSLLIGDAKQTLHPMAGLGANIGFDDVAAMHAIWSKRKPSDAGDARALRAYQRARRLETHKALILMDALQFAFAQDGLAGTLVRNWGLQALDALPWLKNQMIKQANRV